MVQKFADILTANMVNTCTGRTMVSIVKITSIKTTEISTKNVVFNHITLSYTVLISLSSILIHYSPLEIFKTEFHPMHRL